MRKINVAKLGVLVLYPNFNPNIKRATEGSPCYQVCPLKFMTN